MNRQCRVCSKVLELTSDNFKPNSKASGFRLECIECSRAQFREWYQKNKESQRERSTLRYHADPAAAKEANRAWRIDNRERRNQINRESWHRHKEKRIGEAKQWAADNPMRRLAIRVANRAKNCGSPGRFTAEEFIERLEEQRWLCYYCPADLRENLTIDHVVPLCDGGPNTIENVVGCCSSCNSRKGPRPAERIVASACAPC